ncbi:MAG: dual specificity protein phosphatase family protein [Candidatus Rhabdochlamydia sp.]
MLVSDHINPLVPIKAPDSKQSISNTHSSLIEGIDFVEICPQLFLGNQESAQNFFFIQSRKITHIINSASKDFASYAFPGVQHYDIPLSDELNASITPYLAASVNFIKKAQKEGGSVLSHCEQGLSRSVSIVIAYLISEEGMTYRSALNKIREVRPQAQPNPTFAKELNQFYLSNKLQKLSKPSTDFSLKERFPSDAIWQDWSTYKDIRDEEGMEVGYTHAGRWGTSGAGVLVVSSKPEQEFLLFKRSNEVEEPGVWSIPGGARKIKKDGQLTESFNTAISELREEAGLPRGNICKNPIIYEKEGYSYDTYILELAHDKEYYTPRLNWENSEWHWFTKEKLEELSSLHPGAKFVIDHLTD